ncbi:MAG: leucine-rich repeat domain-containing protein, partial [Clostridia bacterium]|nr:leucine-rich repeat domain-containing protein [Clostridia bacterium]
SFAYSLGETELLRGDTLHLHIDESEHATWYDVHIMHDGEQVYGDRFEEPGDYELQAFWPEGEYSLYVTAGALGYSWYNDGEQEPENFTITSPADDPGRLTVSKTELITNENFSWTLYAKGADQVALCMTEDPGNLNAEENHWHEQEGDWAEGNWNSFGHEGTYYLFIGGYFANDEGGYWEYVGEPVEIHVTAPNGDVPVPEVGYASLVPANEDYIFTVRAAENVHYDVSVNWIGDWSFDLMRAEDCEGAQTFTVDSQYIDNPDHFVIRVWYWYSGEMTGYNDGYLEYHFRAEDTPNFDDEKVTLTAEKDHALLNEDVEITVTTQGASEIRLYNLDGEFDAAEGDTWIRTTGEEYLYARALIDGTWYTSSPVTIAREYLGECGRVEYSLGETELLRGDTLHLHIDESEHATWYDVHIMHDGEQVYYFRFEEPGDYELQAFWSDGDYCLYVSAGAPGYGWYDDGEQEQGNFTITSPEDDPGRLTVSKTELATNETFSWTLYAKGADQVALCMTEDPSSLHAEENHWHEQEGDWAEGDWNSFGHEGTYYLFIGGYFASDEGGYWDYVGEPVEIHVTAPHGSAPAPEVSFAGIAASNHDYTYTVRAAKDVIYNTSVVREGNWDVELVSDNGCTGEKTLTLGSEVIGDSAYFVIRVWYWYPETITGYNDGYEEYHFFSVSGNAVLVLPKGLSTIEEEAFEGIAAEQVQIPQGVTRIESRAFAACPNLREVKVPASVTYIADDAFEGDLYLVGPSGSYVESFAESHGLLFQADN